MANFFFILVENENSVRGWSPSAQVNKRKFVGGHKTILKLNPHKVAPTNTRFD